jgi:hypothetical protein
VVEVQQRLLVIADIGGYTRFMLATRISLAHAQLSVAALIEAVLDGARDLTLAKLEGDAAFFEAAPATVATLHHELAEIRRQFLKRRAELVAERMCTCAGCMQLEQLTLKFVAHVGEVARHRVRGREELAGVDVILVHRLLKNRVPITEYLLMTEPVRRALPSAEAAAIVSGAEELEGLGPTPVHWLDTAVLADVPALPRPGLVVRLLKKLAMELRSVPWLLGLRRRRLRQLES